MALTVTAIKAAKPKAKPYKLADEKGLSLIVSPSGGMLWRWKYRVDGIGADGQPKRIEKVLALGAYPDVGLQAARERRDAARQQLANGIDPAEKKQRDKRAAKIGAANTFHAVATNFIEKCRRDGLADTTLRKRQWTLGLVTRAIGNRPIAEIKPIDILDAVRPYEAAKNHEKARRTLEFVGAVFRYGVANQLVGADPTRDLRGALASRRPKHLAAILDPKRVGELLRAIDGYEGQGIRRGLRGAFDCRHCAEQLYRMGVDRRACRQAAGAGLDRRRDRPPCFVHHRRAAQGAGGRAR